MSVALDQGEDASSAGVVPLNFVVITTDDQGRWAMPHRMPELIMPHMEKLLAD